MKSFLILFLFTATIFASTPTLTEEVNTTNQLIKVENNLGDGFNDEFNGDNEVDVYDPLSGYNRIMTDFNDFMYINMLNPVATGYSNVVHKNIRKGVSNVFNNLFFPIRFVNNILQLKFQNAAEETARFLLNSTFGILGIFDPALDNHGLKPHKEDFGQTLGFYGVGPGPHIVLPLLGPSNLRDTISIIPDSILNPASQYFYDTDITATESMLVLSLYYVNKTSLRLGQYESLKKDAIDLYPFLRDLYEQKRLSEIKE